VCRDTSPPNARNDPSAAFTAFGTSKTLTAILCVSLANLTPNLFCLFGNQLRSKKHDLNMIFLAGPGHGAPAILPNTYLEGTDSENTYAHGIDKPRSLGGTGRFDK
jgi:hypothetical protein